MHPLRINCRDDARQGLILRELIVVLIVMLLLMSLTLPAILSARREQRRVQCLENLKNLGLATSNYYSVHNGNLPPLWSAAPNQTAASGNVTWTLALLPYFDRRDDDDRVASTKTLAEATSRIQLTLRQKYQVLQCPQDVAHFDQPGGISYAANIGYGAWWGARDPGKNAMTGIASRYDFKARDHSDASIDWNGNGKSDPEDVEVARSTGVWWNAGPGKGSMGLDEINEGDGTSSTLLFVESVSLPLMHQTGPQRNGFNPEALDIGRGLGYASLRLSKQSPPRLGPWKFIASEDFTNYFRPNSGGESIKGVWPGASSGHDGVVNVVFAAGYSTSISEKIDWKVWGSLHSPNGVSWGQPPISDAIW